MPQKKELDRILSSYKVLGKGAYGTVYSLGDGDAIKVFDGPMQKSVSDTIIHIKNLQLGSLYKIKEVLYDNEYSINKKMIAYIMQEYPKNEIDLLVCNTSFFLNNYYQTLEDFKTLAKEHIMVEDLHPGNTMITKEKIVLIDADIYEECHNADPLFIEYINKRRLRILYILLLYKAIRKYHDNNSELKEVLKEYLNNYDIDTIEDALDSYLERFFIEIKDYNTILEFLNDKKNKTHLH